MPVINQIPIRPKFPAKPRDPKKLAEKAIKLISVGENASLQEAVLYLQEGISWLVEARDKSVTVLTHYEWIKIGYRLLGTSYVEAHVIGSQWVKASEAADPDAAARVNVEFEKEANSTGST